LQFLKNLRKIFSEETGWSRQGIHIRPDRFFHDSLSGKFDQLSDKGIRIGGIGSMDSRNNNAWNTTPFGTVYALKPGSVSKKNGRPQAVRGYYILGLKELQSVHSTLVGLVS
jgi:hypothetical protein